MISSLLLAVHLLAAVIWVGGMAFALMVLRPSLAILAPPDRLALHRQVFQRFFRIVWHVMPLLLLSGYGLLATLFGGFAGAPWPVHVMHLGGLVMAAVFAVIFFGPWPALRTALDSNDPPRAVAAIDRLRRLITINLAIGLLVVAIAAIAP